MYKLLATILKDFRILLRDKVGLTLIFMMPVALALIITAVQNSTFELVNHNKMKLLLCNKDNGDASRQLVLAIEKSGMFDTLLVPPQETDQAIIDRMQGKDALIGVVISKGFSDKIIATATQVTSNALKSLDLKKDTLVRPGLEAYSITLYYHPVLQQSFRESIRGALNGALQLVQSKQIVKSLYSTINETDIPDSLENMIVNNQIPIDQIPVSRDNNRAIPNATQHNIPAWTIFAMFFIVISLGSSLVREKTSGSFIRLKTLPTNYLIALIAKQIAYLFITLTQAAVIFAIGIWLFPSMGLPILNLPKDLTGLIIVSLICGWCAVSYAILIGVFSQTQEQSNGIGAISIILFAAIGGLLVPSFAMPASFKPFLYLSPLHWCLEAYYGLFLEGGKLKDVFRNILPLLGMIIFMQLLTLYGLKKKNLI